MNPLAKYWLNGLTCEQVCARFNATPAQVQAALVEAGEADGDRYAEEFPPARTVPRETRPRKKRAASK